MDKYFQANRELWDKSTPVHVQSKFYDVEGFKAGQDSLAWIERAALGDVRGKSLLHLQCHFGMDTLSWARSGARATGVDFSPVAINTAKELSREIGVDATFVLANIYDLPDVLQGTFDIVYTGGGAITWLPDMHKWAMAIAHFLKPGGTFFVSDGHPFAMVFDDDKGVRDYVVRYPYFHSDEPLHWENDGDYAEPTADIHGDEYGWQHSISDIVNALIAAGMQIDEIGEYPFVRWKMFPFMEQADNGWWRLPDKYVQIPLMFSLKATKR